MIENGKLLHETHEFGIQAKIHSYGYDISLPHSCDRWNILGEGKHNAEESLITIETFITELQECTKIISGYKGE